MKHKMTKTLVHVAAWSALGVAVYAFLLNDDAKAEVRKAMKDLGDSVAQMFVLVREITSTGTGQASDLPNREETLEQWEALGF